MDLHDALTQIAEIRRQVSRTETYRGYRALPVALSGVLACLAGWFQSWSVIEPARQLVDYLALWITAASLSLAVTGVFMLLHCLHSPSPWTRSLTMLAVAQFVPCVIAGGLVTFVFARFAPESAWLLPGLWSIFFALAVFSSFRLLPKATFWVAVYYLAAGCVCLVVGRDEWAFSPWLMIGTFGAGQFAAAGVLYWTLERNHDET
jgi:hypothetical protein